MKRRFAALTLSILATMLAAPPSVLACSFDSQAYFTFTTHPDVPLAPFAKGNLGIVEGTYARSYLLTAYRYMSGKPLNAEEQKAVVDLWNTRLTATDFNGCTVDTKAWETARGAVAGMGKMQDIYTEKPINNDEAWQTFCNCQQSAFDTAVKTLKELSTKYGANSPNVKEWVTAQDAVFSNCGVPSWSDKKPATSMPAPLPSTADAYMQAQRNYQIAAANFYAQKYDQAAQEFEKIAADASSPWHELAGYLAVRCMIRKASLEKTIDKPMLTKAQERINALLSNPSYSTLATDLKALASYISARLTPEQHLQALVNQPLTGDTLGEITKTIDILVGSGESEDELKYDKQPASLRQSDPVDWMMTYQSDEPAAKQHAIAEWKKTHSVPWLVAAASTVDGTGSDADAIVAAATAAEKDNPAKWTLFYHVNRINLEKGKDAQVREALDKVLNAPPADLPRGALNELKTQRLPSAKNLAEFVRFGVQKPLCQCTNGGTEQVPDDADTITGKGKPEDNPPVFTAEAGQVIQAKLPLSVLKQLSLEPTLSAALRKDVAWTSWVRAALIGDDAAGKELAQINKTLTPAKAKFFDSYLAAATPEDRRFAAANLMLHYSSAVPNATFGDIAEDGYGDSAGWWWSASPSVTKVTVGYEGEEVDDIDPLFLTDAQRAQAKAQIAKLGKVAAAPNYFANVVLPYAKAHPADPRVPEALAWLVKATHYGMTDDASHAFSKQAFTLLHTKYKTSPWTKKTPYYY